ncbi:hypothetical protein CN988_27225 [Bacillus thuringiensis]|nr:hypothetical protein DT250_28545 [Bacillus sp. AR2-1]PFD65965.1 hypothetical protein CN309_11740 [Bacillus thuringiensis]PFF25999.1 hypothetical protein CN332_12225 [Bacillus thuringiensis]PFO36463.1 hypothetical protein COJ84_25005 [Bacillus thuringiensis]PFR53283.1 hypothetical protein COK34_20030 [Bacillus thuringiensis]
MSLKPLILLTFFIFSISLLYIGLKVPQGTGSIFEKNTQKSPPLLEKSRLVNPRLKSKTFLFSNILAELFLARLLSSPSR